MARTLETISTLRPIRILVTGSRNWTQPFMVTRALDGIEAQRFTTHKMLVVHGNCNKGADYAAKQWCLDMDGYAIDHEPHAAVLGSGNRGGPLRNKYMVNLGADVCLAFIRDNSSGATGCARMAEEAGIPTARYLWDAVNHPRPILQYGKYLSWSFSIAT